MRYLMAYHFSRRIIIRNIIHHTSTVTFSCVFLRNDVRWKLITILNSKFSLIMSMTIIQFPWKCFQPQKNSRGSNFFFLSCWPFCQFFQPFWRASCEPFFKRPFNSNDIYRKKIWDSRGEKLGFKSIIYFFMILRWVIELLLNYLNFLWNF